MVSTKELSCLAINAPLSHSREMSIASVFSDHALK